MDLRTGRDEASRLTSPDVGNTGAVAKTRIADAVAPTLNPPATGRRAVGFKLAHRDDARMPFFGLEGTTDSGSAALANGDS
jgi:hypothetical protein